MDKTQTEMECRDDIDIQGLIHELQSEVGKLLNLIIDGNTNFSEIMSEVSEKMSKKDTHDDRGKTVKENGVLNLE